MRLTLVDNFIMPDGLDPAFFDVHPHIGLTSLAAVAHTEGHEVAIYDPKREVRFGRCAYDKHFYQRAAEDILRTSPDAVGFTTLGCSFLFAVRVAGIIKQAEPQLPILLGGPHATMLDRRILESYAQFDIVVRHEAESTLLPLLARLSTRAFDSIPGLTWRAGQLGQIKSTPGMPKIEDLDELPIPAYDLYPVRDLGLTLMRVEAGRGCPFNCTFCSTATFFQRSYRLKSPGRLLREMDLLNARYGTTEFKLDHDLFTVDRHKVRAFCEAVKDRGYHWRASARTDCIDEELLESMAIAGCVSLYFGIETGSKRMQKISEKRLKLDGVESMLNLAEGFAIESTVSFITGYPEEDREDQDATLDMLGRCFSRPEAWCLPQLHVLLPEPGTPMFAQHYQALSYDGYVTPFNARLLREDDIDQILKYPDLYATYYYYPAVMLRREYTFVVDAVDALRTVGHEALSYTLRFYEGRLSRFIQKFKCWAEKERAGAPVSPELVVDFIGHAFTPAHHLTSLFRFRTAMSRCKFAVSSAPAPSANGLSEKDVIATNYDKPIRLRREILVFADLHDCDALLARIRCQSPGAPPLDDISTGDRCCHVVVMREKQLMHYRLAAGAEALLLLFDEPKMLSTVLTVLHAIAPDAPDPKSFLDDLAQIGVLVPAEQVAAVA